MELFQIKNRFNGNVLFELECESLKICLETAIKRNANLRRADLQGADLQGANLQGADLQGADLQNANLQYADLRWADLRNANLRWADLRNANLRYANLQDADLQNANLRWADLRNADLRRANLQDANLRNANLQDANLRRADLRWADLRNADLRRANLRYANLPNFKIIPEVGGFYAWKKTTTGTIKIYIPPGAKRVNSLKGRKCRASFVKVISGKGCGGTSPIKQNIVYNKGETIYPDSFDDDIRRECTNGIHFFITKEEAENF